jgi:galactokinase
VGQDRPFDVEQLVSRFSDIHGGEPDLVIRSPGRVNLVGDHTDYNGGLAMPTAISQAVYIASRLRNDRTVDVATGSDPDRATFHLDALDRTWTGWVSYLQGVAYEMLGAGHELQGWDGLVASDLPVGAGLSSSAALELAVARTFVELAGEPWNPRAIAHLCQRAENGWVGVKSGLLDQFSSALGVEGKMMLIDFLTLDVTYVPVPEPAGILILDTGTRRELVDSEYNVRRHECAEILAKLDLDSMRGVEEHQLAEFDPVLRRRARHLINENHAVAGVAAAFRSGDLAAAGDFLSASHRSLRDDYEVSSAELDAMVDAASVVEGVFGARMTGGGFGGSVVALVDGEAAASIGAEAVARYQSATGLTGNLLIVRPAGGTSVVAAG